MQWNPLHTATLPKTPGPEVKQDHVHVSRSSPTLTEDSFVVHMPSSREPQPFAYPGYTAEQIEALEHYQRKTRRVSSEGYDRRLLPNCNKPSTTLSAAEYDNNPTDENGPAIYTGPTGQHFIAYRYHQGSPHDPSPSEPPRIHVRKRKTQVDRIRQEIDTAPRVEEEAKLFASRKITRSAAIDSGYQHEENPRYHHHYKILRTVPAEEAYRQPPPPPTTNPSSSKHAQICSAPGEISGKSIFGSAPSCRAVANAAHAAAGGDHYHAEADGKLPRQQSEMVLEVAPPDAPIDLCSQLPRVKLVRPEYAGVPQLQLRDGGGGTRQCSFGCRREGSNGECAERRRPSTSTVVRGGSRHVSTSFIDHTPEQARASSNDSRARIHIIISTIARLLVDYAKSVQVRLPEWIAVIVEMVSSSPDDDTPAKEKLEALKALGLLVGHGLVVCVGVAMVWKVVVAVLNLVEVVLWPLAVPLRVVRFMLGLG